LRRCWLRASSAASSISDERTAFYGSPQMRLASEAAFIKRDDTGTVNRLNCSQPNAIYTGKLQFKLRSTFRVSTDIQHHQAGRISQRLRRRNSRRDREGRIQDSRHQEAFHL